MRGGGASPAPSAPSVRCSRCRRCRPWRNRSRRRRFASSCPFRRAARPISSGRPFAQLLAESSGQQVIVDNRGGAGGSIGADIVAKAPPDGYTLLVGTVGTRRGE
jgi:hypothetical protein